MHLKALAECELDTLMIMAVKGWIAWDREQNVVLYPSYGRRKTGRGTKYTVSCPGDWHFHLTAHSDQEAIEKANKRLAKER